MKGLELSKKFYFEYGEPMLKEQFPDVYPYLAVGFTGRGSERYGFDDEISQDHDFEVGFTVFMPDESIVDRRTAFNLERAYNKLPKEYMGIKRQLLSPVGGNRNGPVRTEDFYFSEIGSNYGILSPKDWLTLPDYSLCEAVNGEIFYDGLGEVSAIRERLSTIPEDIRKKRIAGNLLIMTQSGQYNLMRSVKRNDLVSASFCVFEFVKSAIKVLFLLKGKFAPYYKWSFHALKQIEDKEITDLISSLLLNSNCIEDVNAKSDTVEKVCSLVIKRLKEQGLTKAESLDIEKHAYSVNDGIEDGNIRNLNILVSVNEI